MPDVCFNARFVMLFKVFAHYIWLRLVYLWALHPIVGVLAKVAQVEVDHFILMYPRREFVAQLCFHLFFSVPTCRCSAGQRFATASVVQLVASQL
jgi:hypothetical protein